MLELPEIIEKTLKTLKAIGNLYCAFKKSGKNKSNANQDQIRDQRNQVEKVIKTLETGE